MSGISLYDFLLYEAEEEHRAALMAPKRQSAGSRRRQKIDRATPRWLTREHHYEMHGIYCRAKFMNRKWRGRQMAEGSQTDRHRNYYSVDHIIPLDGSRVCGLHVPWNLRIIEKAVDNRQGNKLKEGEPEHGLPPFKT
jgi:hypothetical protein